MLGLPRQPEGEYQMTRDSEFRERGRQLKAARDSRNLADEFIARLKTQLAAANATNARWMAATGCTTPEEWEAELTDVSRGGDSPGSYTLSLDYEGSVTVVFEDGLLRKWSPERRFCVRPGDPEPDDGRHCRECLLRPCRWSTTRGAWVIIETPPLEPE